MKRRIATVFLAILLAAGMLTPVVADESENDETKAPYDVWTENHSTYSVDYTYYDNDDGTVTVNGIRRTILDSEANDAYVMVPRTINGKHIKAIQCSSWDCSYQIDFSNCSYLESLSFQGEIKENITSLIPDSLKELTLTVGDDDIPLHAIKTLDLTCFTELRRFSSRGLLVRRLDLHGLKRLEEVKCTYCYDYSGVGESVGIISSINLSGCINLKECSCEAIGLQKINLNKCKALKTLKIYNDGNGFYGNYVKSLNLDSCVNLTELDCSENNLNKLDVSKCRKLRYLNCSSNQIRKLNLKSNKKIKELNCSNNCMETLDLSANNNLKTVDCSWNNLRQIVKPSAKKRLKGDCRHNFLNRYQRKNLKKVFGNKKVIPQDKIGKNSVGDLYIWPVPQTVARYNQKSAIYLIPKGHFTRWQVDTGASKYQISKKVFGSTGYRYRVQLKIGKKWYSSSWKRL